MLSIASALALLSIASVRAQLRPGAANGPTNPAQPSLGTPLNQTSDARLISLNSYDDFCLFGPPEYRAETTTDANGQVQYESSIGNVEPIVVAWCTQQRNNARLIPDGVIQSAHFVKTPSYVQIRGFGDLTQLNIPYGDYGGELDPHGATNQGNPHGGNATTNVTGSDTFWGEWMMFVSYNQFCLRICTAEPNFPAPVMCEHKLDVMGCDFVMPGTSANGSFTSCDGDDALPPGVYPVSGGGYSTFAQRYTGTYTDNGTPVGYTVGVTSTPSAAFSVPASSNCVTHSTVANGVAAVQMNPDFNQGALTATTDGTVRPTASASGSVQTPASASDSVAAPAGGSTSPANASNTRSSSSSSEAAASGSEKTSGTGTNTRAVASGTRATTTGTGTASTARNSSEPATGSASSTVTAPLSVLLFTVVASLFVTGAFAIVA